MLLALFWLVCNAARHVTAPDVSYGRISVLLVQREEIEISEKQLWYLFHGARRARTTRSTTKALSVSQLYFDDLIKLQLQERLPSFSLSKMRRLRCTSSSSRGSCTS
ncbi:unnamed protein product [Amoebophrya sp. A120]|nr:unnamed protein product [Amoebophrya sp. A120]|eukprot:GSA120T00004592001.1